MNGNTEYISVGLIRYKEAMKETSAEKHALWNVLVIFSIVFKIAYFQAIRTI